MRILVTNDDGIMAEGILALANELAQEHEVMVVAPDQERSACSHSVTMNLPLSVKPCGYERYAASVKALSCSGTPVDCVKIALSTLYPNEIDLVISGINFGANIGADIFYSATVNAALDALIFDIPSIAVSQEVRKPLDMARMYEYMQRDARILHEMLQNEIFTCKKNYILNVNFPYASLEKTPKPVVCRHGKHVYMDAYEKRIDPFGREYYWFYGKPVEGEGRIVPESDHQYLREGRITITPLHADLTDLENMEKCNF